MVLVPDYAATDVFVKNIHSRAFSPPGDISESILDIGYRSILDISESILNCDIFLKLASHNSTFQCILGLFTGLLIVRCLYKSPTWLNCSRLNNFHSIISLKCWWSGPSWWSLLMLRSQLVMASLFLITSSLAVFSLLLWAGFDPNWSDLDNSQKSTWAIDCWWIPTFLPSATLLLAPFQADSTS